MTAIERFFEFIEVNEFRPTAIEKDLGLSNGYLGKMRKRKSSIGSEVIEKIINKFKDLNPEWFLTGNGNMLRTQTDEPSTNWTLTEDYKSDQYKTTAGTDTYTQEPHKNKNLKEIIDNQQKTIRILEQTIKMQQETILYLIQKDEKQD